MVHIECDGCGLKEEMEFSIQFNGFRNKGERFWHQYTDPKRLPRVLDLCSDKCLPAAIERVVSIKTSEGYKYEIGPSKKPRSIVG